VADRGPSGAGTLQLFYLSVVCGGKDGHAPG
jgi:hypothetical protein